MQCSVARQLLRRWWCLHSPHQRQTPGSSQARHQRRRLRDCCREGRGRVPHAAAWRPRRAGGRRHIFGSPAVRQCLRHPVAAAPHYVAAAVPVRARASFTASTAEGTATAAVECAAQVTLSAAIPTPAMAALWRCRPSALVVAPRQLVHPRLGERLHAWPRGQEGQHRGLCMHRLTRLGSSCERERVANRRVHTSP